MQRLPKPCDISSAISVLSEIDLQGMNAVWLGDTSSPTTFFILAQAEYAFNSMPNSSTKTTLFVTVYGRLPQQPMDISVHMASLPNVGEKLGTTEDIHQWVPKNIAEANEKYKEQTNQREQLIWRREILSWYI